MRSIKPYIVTFSKCLPYKLTFSPAWITLHSVAADVNNEIKVLPHNSIPHRCCCCYYFAIIPFVRGLFCFYQQAWNAIYHDYCSIRNIICLLSHRKKEAVLSFFPVCLAYKWNTVKTISRLLVVCWSVKCLFQLINNFSLLSRC